MHIKHGTITTITPRETDFSINYEILDTAGAQGVFLIDKTETTQGDFIAAATGKPVEVFTDHLNRVFSARINDRLVLDRRFDEPLSP